MPRALAISTLMHGILVGLLLLGGRFSWPAPPIPIEVKPMRRHARPVEKPAPKPQPPKDDVVKPGAGATPKKKLPKPQPPEPPAPPTTDLKPFAPDDAHVVVLLRMDKLRRSPHRAGTEALLSAMPDWSTLVDGSGVSPIDDFDALLIASADPRDATATFLAARHADTPKLRALTSRTLPAGDARVFRQLAPGLTVLARPEAARKLDVPDGGAEAERGWLHELEAFDHVAQASDGPALLVTIPDVQALVSFGGGLPTPLAMGLAVTADASPLVRAQLVFADGASAEKFAAAWPEILGRYRTATALLGLSPALDQLKLSVRGTVVELAGVVPEGQVRLGLGFAKALFPEREGGKDMR